MSPQSQPLSQYSDRPFDADALAAVLNDPTRVAAVCRVAEISDASNPAFDRLTNLTARVLAVPSVTITLVHDDRQSFKSAFPEDALPPGVESVPLELSFCKHTVVMQEPLVIDDAREHPHLRFNAATLSGEVIAYAGVPLIDDDGAVIGSLCAHDSRPRRWTANDVAVLRDLAAGVITEIALREDIARREIAERRVRESEARFRAMFEHSPEGIVLVSNVKPREIVGVNPAFEKLYGGSAERLLGLVARDLMDSDDADQLRQRVDELKSLSERTLTGDVRLTRADGSVLWCSLTVSELPGSEQLIVYARDVDERKRAEIENAALAQRDSLTGLHNRRSFDVEIERLAAGARRYGESAALLLIDVDNFKSVNDTFGHAGGDAILVAVARAMTDTVRGTDVVARIGGDEFAVLLHHVEPGDALAVAEKIRSAIAAARAGNGGAIGVTSSIGVAHVEAGDVPDAEQLLRSADAALYAAKAAGKDRVSALAGHQLTSEW